MTKLVILGGNSIHNKARVAKLEDTFRDEFKSMYAQHYLHRESDYQNMNLEEELDILTKTLEDEQDFIILAKSLGCILALLMITEKKILPKKCIFVGFPMGFVESHEFPLEEYLLQLQCPVLFIQKTQDPACYFEELEERTSGFSENFSYEEVPGENHHYENIAQLKNLVLDFVKE